MWRERSWMLFAKLQNSTCNYRINSGAADYTPHRFEISLSNRRLRYRSQRKARQWGESALQGPLELKSRSAYGCGRLSLLDLPFATHRLRFKDCQKKPLLSTRHLVGQHTTSNRKLGEAAHLPLIHPMLWRLAEGQTSIGTSCLWSVDTVALLLKEISLECLVRENPVP